MSESWVGAGALEEAAGKVRVKDLDSRRQEKLKESFQPLCVCRAAEGIAERMKESFRVRRS